MTRVVALADSLRWEPNAPEAVLSTDDGARAVLALNPHFDDGDQSAVVLLWRGVYSASMGYPNDEGRRDHSLYHSGLNTLVWMGEVQGGPQVPRPFGPQPRHFLLPLKETVVEVLADSYAVVRILGSTRDAMTAALSLDWNSVQFRFGES